MLKKAALIILAIALSACTLHKVTNKEQLCEQAKRQQVYNANSPSIDTNYITPAQSTRLNQQAAANC